MCVFDEILQVKEKFNFVQDKIEYLQIKADSPRSSIISDMPKGGRHDGNPLEEYIVRKEELSEKLARYKAMLDELWEEAFYQMKLAEIDEQLKAMMILRFSYGLKWEKCATTLNKKFPDGKWTTGKCFRKYREVLRRIEAVERKSKYVHN